MKLTAVQIQELFLFTEKKYVRHYDLQVELVDHLASRIEEEMSLHKGLDFDKALKKVYNEFGIFGFSKIVQEKEKQVYKAGQRLLWNEIQNLFRLPRILMVLCISLATWQLTEWVSLDILFPLFFIAWVTFTLYCTISSNKVQRPKRQLLMLQFHANQSIFPFVMFEFIFIFREGYSNPILFCAVVIIGIIMKIASWQVYRNVHTKAIEQYPEAFAS